MHLHEPCRCDHDGVNEHDISITMLIKNLPPLKQQLSFCIVWICIGWYISTVARFLLMVWKLFHVCYNAHSAQKIKHIFMLGAKYAQNWHSLDRPSVQHSCSPDGVYGESWANEERLLSRRALVVLVTRADEGRRVALFNRMHTIVFWWSHCSHCASLWCFWCSHSCRWCSSHLVTFVLRPNPSSPLW